MEEEIEPLESNATAAIDCVTQWWNQTSSSAQKSSG